MKHRFAFCLFIVLSMFFIGCSTISKWFPAAPVPKEGVIKVACIGDSLTHGAGTENIKTDSYPAQLQALIGNDYQVLNYGLFGRSLQKSALMSYTKERFYKASQEAQPNLVIIMLGSNDSAPGRWNAANYEKDLRDFVSTYQNLDSKPVIYLMKCPPSYETRPRYTDMSVLVNEVNPIVEKVAEQMGIQTIDIFSALVNHPELFPDGLHPNAAGAKIIAEEVYRAVMGH